VQDLVIAVQNGQQFAILAIHELPGL
jgi:hypothetical protein